MTEMAGDERLQEELATLPAAADSFTAGVQRRFGHWLLAGAPLAGALRPTVSTQLDTILAAARAHGASLWCFPDDSGVGAIAEPSDRPVIAVDLRGLDRIVNVDTLSATALVEPGVTFSALNAHLREREPRLWCGDESDAHRSVAGTIWSRGLGYGPYGDRTLMQCGMEVLLADGQRVRTGMGALPAGNMWQLFKYGYGPYTDGAFQQSTFAIPTLVGSWLMPAPPVAAPFSFTITDTRALSAAIDALRPLKITPVIPSTVVLSNGPYLRSLGARALPEGDGTPAWTGCAALYGSPADIDIVRQAVAGTLKPIDSVGDVLPLEAGESLDDRRRALFTGGPDTPTRHPTALEITAACAPEGAAATAIVDIVTRVAAKYRYPPACEFRMAWRTLLAHLRLPFDDTSDDEITRSLTCGDALVNQLNAAGFGVVSASTVLLPATTAAFDNGMATLRERVKSALDPESVVGGAAAPHPSI